MMHTLDTCRAPNHGITGAPNITSLDQTCQMNGELEQNDIRVEWDESRAKRRKF